MTAAAAARAHEAGTTRDDWFRAAFETLVEDGVDRVKITTLTSRLKASRSSFYWFYANRDAVLADLFAHWAAKNTPALIGRAEAPAESLTAAVLGVLECWINEALFDVRLETAMRDWGRNDARVAEAVRAADLERIEALRRLFARHGTPAREDFARAQILYLNQTGYYTVGDVRDLEFRISFLQEYMIVLTGRRAAEADIAAFVAHARRVNGRDPKTGRPLEKGGV